MVLIFFSQWLATSNIFSWVYSLSWIKCLSCILHFLIGISFFLLFFFFSCPRLSKCHVFLVVTQPGRQPCVDLSHDWFLSPVYLWEASYEAWTLIGRFSSMSLFGAQQPSSHHHCPQIQALLWNRRPSLTSFWRWLLHSWAILCVSPGLSRQSFRGFRSQEAETTLTMLRNGF